jgi:hypothetical protein
VCGTQYVDEERGFVGSSVGTLTFDRRQLCTSDMLERPILQLLQHSFPQLWSIPPIRTQIGSYNRWRIREKHGTHSFQGKNTTITAITLPRFLYVSLFVGHMWERTARTFILQKDHPFRAAWGSLDLCMNW